MKNSISVEKIHGADWIQPYHLMAGSKEISHQDCLCISSLEENHVADEKKTRGCGSASLPDHQGGA
jgi:hypothetical protein